jgi:hypothetical protein
MVILFNFSIISIHNFGQMFLFLKNQFLQDKNYHKNFDGKFLTGICFSLEIPLENGDCM